MELSLMNSLFCQAFQMLSLFYKLAHTLIVPTSTYFISTIIEKKYFTK